MKCESFENELEVLSYRIRHKEFIIKDSSYRICHTGFVIRIRNTERICRTESATQNPPIQNLQHGILVQKYTCHNDPQLIDCKDKSIRGKERTRKVSLIFYSIFWLFIGFRSRRGHKLDSSELEGKIRSSLLHGINFTLSLNREPMHIIITCF